MDVFVLVREDQNEHGFIDTSIVGIFASEELAKDQEALELQRAQDEGLIVEDDESDADWQVCWRIEEHVVSEALIPFTSSSDERLRV